MKATGNVLLFGCKFNRQEVANTACLQDMEREELEADEQSNI